MDFKALVEERLKGHAHDFLHTERVVKNALMLAKAERADIETVETAAWLHDLGRPHESKTGECHAKESARITRELLKGHPKLEAIVHCIEAHRFSTGIIPNSLEGKILQDADRLDALGAVGVARIFAFGAEHGRPMYDGDDPFGKKRDLKRDQYSLDHFYVKQVKLPSLMHTKSAKKEAERRLGFMMGYLDEFRKEIE